MNSRGALYGFRNMLFVGCWQIVIPLLLDIHNLSEVLFTLYAFYIFTLFLVHRTMQAAALDEHSYEIVAPTPLAGDHITEQKHREMAIRMRMGQIDV